MTREEINRYIHVEIMGYCDESQWVTITEPCPICKGKDVYNKKHSQPFDYCSDESPRRLMHEVEEAVIELLRLTVKNPRVIYCRYLMVANGFSFDDLGYLYEQVIRSTAEQRAKACVDAHKASKGQPTGEENV